MNLMRFNGGLQERFRTLAMHDIPVDAADATATETLQSSWQATVDAALTRDRRLVKIKERFRIVTNNDVAAFQAACDEMRRDYFAHGPSSIGVSLSTGLAAMADYRVKLAAANSQRVRAARQQGAAAPYVWWTAFVSSTTMCIRHLVTLHLRALSSAHVRRRCFKQLSGC